MLGCFFFFFKQKTAYEMRISDWSSDVCSSDLPYPALDRGDGCRRDFDRDRTLTDGIARRLRPLSLSGRDRAGGIRHPRAARAGRGGDGRADAARTTAPAA